jgi:hypothetical protein
MMATAESFVVDLVSRKKEVIGDVTVARVDVRLS